MHTGMRTLSPRNDDSTSSSNLSSQTSLSCSGKDASNPACEKPASSNGLQIGLGVGIPVFLILCVVAFFMFKNYRKEKREMNERDPDFDETGDVTALPDIPGFSSDPFKSGSSINMVGGHGGYPLMSMQNKSVHDFGMITSPTHAFILPDQSQLGSKASLHEFARSSMDLRSHLQRRKSELSVRTGIASMEKMSCMDRMSPARSRATPLSTDENSPDSDGSRESGATTKSSSSDPEFGVRYENESKLPINSTLPSAAKSLKLSAYVKSDNIKSDNSKSDKVKSDKVKSDLIKSDQIKSESEHFESNHINSDRKNFHLDSDDEHSDTNPEIHLSDDEIHFQNASEYPESNVSPFLDSHHFPDSPSVSNPGTTSGKIAQVRETPAHADTNPRLSQFDMLHNVSDEDQDYDIDIPRRSPQRQAKQTSPDQEEQLARMKSVYKVYFSRSNSVVSQKDYRVSHAPFQADAMQPLPSIHPDHLTTNEEVNDHDASRARNTMTSSKYEDDTVDRIIFPYERLDVSQNSSINGYGNQYNGNASQGNAGASKFDVQEPQYNGYVSQSQAYLTQQHAEFPTVAPFQELPRSDENLLPLKSLPSASEIRNSTLETYTLYSPTSKLHSPTLLQQQGYFDGYVSGSPNFPSQASFSTNSSPNLAQYDNEVPPTIRERTTYNTNGTTPSPSQLSRTSVVMLNPVTEITSSRKFKPAGSLPSGMVSPGLDYMNDDLASEYDLIPGNRKSAVRRMMNTNF